MTTGPRDVYKRQLRVFHSCCKPSGILPGLLIIAAGAICRICLLYTSYLAAVIFLLACEKFVESEDFDTGIEVLTLVFVTIYGVLLYLYRTRKDELTRQGWGFWC